VRVGVAHTRQARFRELEGPRDLRFEPADQLEGRNRADDVLLGSLPVNASNVAAPWLKRISIQVTAAMARGGAGSPGSSRAASSSLA
jgi:hypothetical protein